MFLLPWALGIGLVVLFVALALHYSWLHGVHPRPHVRVLQWLHAHVLLALLCAILAGFVAGLVAPVAYRAVRPGVEYGRQQPPAPLPRYGVTLTTLPDTSANIHVGLPFDYNTTAAAVNATADVGFVYGTQYPGQLTNALGTYYMPYDRDRNPSYIPQAHDIAWWKANHPDWIEYRCDKTSVAYEFSDPDVPLDITNPAVLQYMEQTYLAPALSGALGGYAPQTFAGIAFDNLQMTNAGSYSGQRCGHYDSSGAWVQQFNGTGNDPNYRAAEVAWAKTMHAWFTANFPHALMVVNFSVDPQFVSDSNAVLANTDMDFDEQGWTNGNSGPPWYYADSAWLAKTQALQAFLAVPGHSLDSNNQEPVAFSSVTNAQVQWALANYLLTKNSASYVYVAGHQQYGYDYQRPEYNAPIGTPTGALYQSGALWMRDFTNGKAIVNPSSTQSASVTLPAGVYKDLYGAAQSTVTLPPVSGLVLLGSAGGAATPPTPAPTSTPPLAPTSSATASVVPPTPSGTAMTAPTATATPAASATTAASSPTVVATALPATRSEAESLPRLGRASLYWDSTASGRYGVALWSTGDGISDPLFLTTSGTYTVTVAARETAYQGDARLALYVDGSGGPTGSVTVTNTSGYRTYSLRLALSAGAHRLRWVFANDAYGGSSTTDRNAFIDYLTLSLS